MVAYNALNACAEVGADYFIPVVVVPKAELSQYAKCMYRTSWRAWGDCQWTRMFSFACMCSVTPSNFTEHIN